MTREKKRKEKSAQHANTDTGTVLVSCRAQISTGLSKICSSNKDICVSIVYILCMCIYMCIELVKVLIRWLEVFH